MAPDTIPASSGPSLPDSQPEPEDPAAEPLGQMVVLGDALCTAGLFWGW